MNTTERYLRLPSRHLNRKVHLWTFGHWGTPVLVFPSSAGMAHEWRAGGGIEALAPLISAGRIKLYCPESNVSETWTADGDPERRLALHGAYERFIIDELVPWIRADCRSPGARLGTTGVSFGAFYAANAALKWPEVFPWALCLSGRYRTTPFIGGGGLEAYYNDPLAYVPNLGGAELERVRRNTHLTLVVGQGAFEGGCLPETRDLAAELTRKGIPHEADVWGDDVTHQWVWWRRQLRYHLGRRFS